jgi:hypothetical protein
MFMLGFPLLLVPFAIYNIIAFLMPGVTWTGVVSTVHMVSSADWTMSVGDILIALAIFLLCGEVLKSTRIGIRTVVDHAPLILFLGMLVEFLLVKQAATATFFLLLVVSFIDVLSGFAVTLRSAQRDLTVEGIERVSS